MVRVSILMVVLLTLFSTELPKADERHQTVHDRWRGERERFTGKVTIVSGRTMEFEDGTRVLLFAADAPEPGRQCLIGESLYPCDEQAAKFLRKLIDNQTVTCFEYPSGESTCYAGETNLSEAMIRGGWALAGHDGFRPTEIIARERKRGIWRGELVRAGP